MLIVELIMPIFGWMPLPVQVVAIGVTALFSISITLHLITFILDLIPFL